MQARTLLVCALFATPLFAGCGNDDLPAGMLGAYGRDVTYQDGNHRLRLDITPTGISVSGGPGIQTVPVGGSPTAGVARIGAAGSALFKTMKCFNDFSCRFATENGCDGTFTRDSSGSVVLVATGECETWSGKWQPEKDMPPPSSAPSSSASDSASATATATLPSGQVPAATATGTSTATASPSGTATASPSGTASATGLPTALPTSLPTSIPTSIPTANVTCLAKCNDANIACVRECKVSDLDCMKKCSNTLVSCAQKCQ